MLGLRCLVSGLSRACLAFPCHLRCRKSPRCFRAFPRSGFFCVRKLEDSLEPAWSFHAISGVERVPDLSHSITHISKVSHTVSVSSLSSITFDYVCLSALRCSVSVFLPLKVGSPRLSSSRFIASFRVSCLFSSRSGRPTRRCVAVRGDVRPTGCVPATNHKGARERSRVPQLHTYAHTHTDHTTPQ